MRSFRKILPVFIAILFASVAVFSQKQVVVALDGSGNFRSIQEAINSLPAAAKEQRVILIKNGTYKEKIFIDKDFITLKGEDPEKTIVTIAQARDEWRCDNKDDYGTATLNLKGSDISLENLSFINSYGKDNTKERSIACASDSGKTKTIRPYGHQMALRSFNTTRLIVKNCIFRAYGGDTVSPWNTDNGMFYFKDCIMEGGVDFYCPRGWALAENCTFICRDKNAAIWHDGSRYERSKTVLVNCKFMGDDDFKLGRYHRDAQFYLLNCSFAKNMADADIYLVPTNNTILWGRRVYYYNCKKEGGDYAWHKNNLPAGFGINDFNVPWVYDHKWDPTGEEIKMDPRIADEAVGERIIRDSVAENMLLYQRSNGGWPKQFKAAAVNYKRTLATDELKELKAGYSEGIDASIDNGATTKEIRYLAKAFKNTGDKRFLEAAQRGVDYLLKAQYANGGWPQFYPDLSGYRSQVTYNDNAMMNVLNVLYDIVYKVNDMDVVDAAYADKCVDAIVKGVQCILKTQWKQNGKLTAWCAQYNAKTLEPEMARKFELVSLSGMESVGIVRFLMRIEKPSPAIVEAVNAAVEWFNKVKITGYKYVDVEAPNEKSGRDRVLQPDSAGLLWARFYDMNTNEPFFTGRDSERKRSITEVENERRTGYAWYGSWPAKLLATEYPAWLRKLNKN
ncbi:MAG TPA: pectate lyase [Ferruginibacter sp.]|nr:pectate lyase [Ferruginibacter sp.]